MRAIEDEAARMGQLVEDLLLLARLDEERPLATRPIALDRVVELAVSAAKVVDPDRPLDCQLEQPIVVAGDETRLRLVGRAVASAQGDRQRRQSGGMARQLRHPQQTTSTRARARLQAIAATAAPGE
jgi:hypothetical protein